MTTPPPIAYHPLATVTIDGFSLYLTLVWQPPWVETDDVESHEHEGSADLYLTDFGYMPQNHPIEYIQASHYCEAMPKILEFPETILEEIAEEYLGDDHYLDSPPHYVDRVRLIYRLLEEAGVYGGAE